MPSLIKNAYGELIQPGQGEGFDWHTLPNEDKVEDVQMVLSGKRSFGKMDNVIKMYNELHGGDVNKVVQSLTDGMSNGNIPAFKMWESPNTELKKYKGNQ